MAKRYIRINWQDKPSTSTPLNAINLNKMDKGIDDLDNAIEALNDDLAWQSDTVTSESGIFPGSITVYKSNDMVSLKTGITKTDNSVFTTRTLLCTLPEAYKPAMNTVFVIAGLTEISGIINRTAILLITHDGDVYVDLLTSDCKEFIINAMYRI